MTQVHTIAVEFLSPLISEDFTSFDLTDPDVNDDVEVYYDWLFELGIVKSAKLLNPTDDAKLDTCEVTGRTCECYDVEITASY
jgi:hypothetical protein